MIAAGFAIAACSRTAGLAVHAKDSGTTSSDLGPERDLPSDNSLAYRDAAADADAAIADTVPKTSDLGRESATPDAIINKDTGPDSNIVAKDTAPELVARDVAADGGEPLACMGTLVFGTWPLTHIGVQLDLVALRDLNGDGKLDLVNASAQTVSVWLGTGGGRFFAKTDYAIGAAETPQSMAFADLNGDGKLDLVTANYWSGTVSVLLGKGDGTFAAKMDYAVGDSRDGTHVASPTSVALGDLNGDGMPDIVTANRYRNTVSVLLGKGDGTFAAQMDYSPGEGPEEVALGDLNGDGKLDIVTANIDSATVSVLPGRGDGTFASKLDYPVGGDPRSAPRQIALGDLNGDGKLDAVVANYSASSVSVLLGKGDATFVGQTDYAAEQYQDSVGTSVVLVDLNGDGKLDLLTGSSSSVGVLLGKGDGSFAAMVDYPGGIGSVALGDLNGDGKLDLLTRIGSSVGVLLGKGDGTFDTWAISPTGNHPGAIALGDLNGDGKLDVVSANQASETASVLLGKGDGTFAVNVDYPAGNGPAAVALGDLNGDGELDLAVANDNSVSVRLGAGDGSFAGNVDYPIANRPTAIALGDLNGDGKLDMVAVGTVGTASVLLGTGGGMLAANLDYQVGTNPNGVALGDLNGDGKLDMVVANVGFEADWSVSVLLGKGDGTFADKVDYDTGEGPSAVTLGDLNGDGNLDIIMPNTFGSPGTVTVLLGKGDGTFADKVDYDTGDSPNAVALGDLNGDGWVDIVTSHWGDSPWRSGGVSVLLGNGDGTFATKLDYLAGGGSLALGDLNGDGRLDIVTTGNNSVGVLLSSCR
jgi:hypothetical protein